MFDARPWLLRGFSFSDLYLHRPPVAPLSLGNADATGAFLAAMVS
jgi:hypothetical protein